jgi:hypothetical protein
VSNQNSGAVAAGLAALAVVVMLSAVPPPLAAQESPPPARIGNIWEGLSHQPTERDVGAAEQEHGIAPRDQRERAINNDIDQIMHQLLSKEQNGPAAAGH